MAAEWLRADQVAALGQAIDDCAAQGGTPRRLVAEVLLAAPALVAQDGRWRALVGRMWPYMRHRPECTIWVRETAEYCTCRVHDVWKEAQAALAETP